MGSVLCLLGISVLSVSANSYVWLDALEIGKVVQQLIRERVGLGQVACESLLASDFIECSRINRPAKSGKEENSIENETNGCKTAAPAVSGTSLVTATADELARST